MRVVQSFHLLPLVVLLDKLVERCCDGSEVVYLIGEVLIYLLLRKVKTFREAKRSAKFAPIKTCWSL